MLTFFEVVRIFLLLQLNFCLTTESGLIYNFIQRLGWYFFLVINVNVAFIKYPARNIKCVLYNFVALFLKVSL